MQRAWLLSVVAVIVWSAAFLASADVLEPPPRDCPAGSIPTSIYRGGAYCAIPQPCEGGCARGEVCSPVALCESRGTAVSECTGDVCADGTPCHRFDACLPDDPTRPRTRAEEDFAQGEAIGRVIGMLCGLACCASLALAMAGGAIWLARRQSKKP